MKIVTKIGNLFNVTQGHIVHGCNAQGVMGSGVALGVKNLFPVAYDNYIHQHTTIGLTLGVAYPVEINTDLIIWNAITQSNFGAGVRQTSYDAVQTCFRDVNDYIHRLENKKWTNKKVPSEVHIPLIAAARGGGNWEIIREIIEQTMNYPVTLWLPDDTVVGTI